MSFGRTFLYHRDFPKGKIFTDEDEYLLALRSGEWFPAPWLVNEEVPQVVEKVEAVVEKPITPTVETVVAPPKKKRAPVRPAKPKKVKGGY